MRRRALSVMLSLAVPACGQDVATEPDATIGTPSIEGTPVETFEATTCSTAAVLGLSLQIAAEVDCLVPGQLVRFEADATLEITSGAVLPYLGETARADLYAAVAAGGGAVLRVNSAFRTVAQQYLLRRWFELGRCAIAAAAQPGASNHESGRAIDVANYATWIAILAAHGWDQTVPGDPVHFDHLASADIRGADVLAFQRLWNRNALADPIAEDGVYGPTTADRLRRAPAEGFGIGALCGSARISPASEVPIAAPVTEACAH